MGITGNCAKFLNYARIQGASFSKSLMLGRQQIFISQQERFELEKVAPGISKSLAVDGDFSESLFKFLGAETIDSLDYSDYEKSTIIHDLNKQVPASLLSKYTLIFDGGTLEHVFNYPTAIKNCMDMLKVGGHFVSISPANNFCGHGFYQLSPELFFSVFNESHGFRLMKVLLLIENEGTGVEWYEVSDPKSVKTRVTVTNSHPISVVTISVKLRDTCNIELRPMQSDYAHIWSVHKSIKEDVGIEGEHKLLFYYRRFVPGFIKAMIRSIRTPQTRPEQNLGSLGQVHRQFFKRVEI